MKKFFTGVFVLCAAVAAFSQTVASPTSIKVTADSMQYYGNQKRSSFTGNVVAVSEDYTLTANLVNIFLNDTNEISQIDCTGTVTFKNSDIIAASNSASLTATNKTIILNGEVKVHQGENYLEGEKMTIQYETMEVTVEKGNTERVTIIFNNADALNLP